MAAIVINIAGSYDDKALSQAQRDLQKLKAGADASAAGLAGAFSKAGDKLKEVGGNISAFGKKMTLGVTLPIVGIGVAAIAIQKDFEQSMNQLAVMTGAPEKQLRKLSDLAMQMGADTVFSAGEAADAMLELAKAGFTPAEISGGALQSTMALAATEGLVLADAATIVTQTMNAFGIQAKDSASAVDILAAGAVASTASVADLSGGLKYVGATAGTMGVPLQDVVTGLASLSNAGIDGTTAGTSLNRMLLSLAGTTPKAAAAIKEYGLKFYDAEGQVKPMIEIVDQLQKSLGGLNDKQRTTALKAIFGVEGMRAANILIDQGVKGYENLTTAVGQQGVAQELADARMSGTAGAIEQLKGSLETAALTIGEALAPAVSKVAGFIKDLADRFTALSPETKTMIVIIAAVAAAMGPLLVVIGSVISAIGALSGAMAFLIANPVVLAIIGIVAAIAALVIGVKYAYENFEGFRNFVDSVWSGIQAVVGYVVDWFMAYVWPILSEVFGYIQTALGVLFEVYKAYWGFIWQVVQKVVAWFMEYVWPTLSQVFTFIGQALLVLWEAYKSTWTLIFNILKTVIEWIVANVWPKIQAAFSAIGSALSVLWNAYKTYFTFIWDLLKAVISWITGTLWPNIQTAFNAIRDVVQSLWEKFQSAFNLIKSHVQSVIDTVIGILKGIGTIVSTVIGYFDSIRQGIVDKFNAAVTFVSGIPGKILAAMGGVASTLFSAGSDLIGGLIEGIKARAGEVLSTIASFITDKIPQWVKDRLGISSPSKVMMDIGKWIPAGLAAGIEKASDLVKAATRKLVEATTGEARKSAKGALEEARKAAAELARRTSETIRDSAITGLDRVKDKAREVLDYVRSVRDDIRAFGGVMGTEFDKGTLTSGTIIEQMRDRLRVAQNFAGALTTLRSLGLNNTSLQEILRAGPGQGLEIAQALASGGSSAVGEVNTLEALLARTGSYLGDVGAQSQFGTTSGRAQGIVDTQVNVANGAIVINFGAGVDGRDRLTIQQEIERAVREGLSQLAREIRAS